MMKAGNPNPLANPLNSRNQLSFSINTSKLDVPHQDVPLYGTPEWHAKYESSRRLTVPNQDIPYGQSMHANVRFLANDMIQLSDGTVVDFKRRTILRKGREFHDNDVRWISHPLDAYRDHPISDFDAILGIAMLDDKKQIVRSQLDPNMMLDAADLEYWIKAEEETEKLRSEMTDEQRQMIDDFEKHFPKSKLIDESKKMLSPRHHI